MQSVAMGDPKVGRLGFVAGLIAADKRLPFERLLFRATRGNMFLRTVAVGRVQVCLVMSVAMHAFSLFLS